MEGNYIILTNKDEYQTNIHTEGLEVIETYEYYFFNQLRAKYTIAKVTKNDIKITLTEEKDEKKYINNIPVKFFEVYETIEGAHEELDEITGPDSDNARLEKLNEESII
ncbi:hypothetical protein [Desertibacillus haloalkaliphilus]|uniref:hypothetical protein n=1 Tax=Desertibacillus haloalkaliphilus TaxID=1328930 RepID=UPI001C265777|nr:hypothetical protein [Desertibacillus haloalkaliphilus]MBU8908241.1 hypothetical protein [Desertibacillus haloalkaliphilus]